ncbi:MAG TPA: L-2-hydroxyglutarate oxidase [Streptosporangiaceae bacterium]|nr:L-2-hydroxyglutarate oxidase [Streptosporangiaceae bacterium]
MTSLKSVGVVGAGILGLAVARELTIRFPGVAVTVFEKEGHVAAHQSGHNSGVVHAGVYYPPGSLKASLCRRGAAMTREFCEEHGVALRELGKLIVAVSEQELPGLAEIEHRSTRNQVPGIRRIGPAQIAEIEPHIRGVAALHSPSTAAVDYIAMCEELARAVKSSGGEVLLSTQITNVTETPFAARVSSAAARWDLDYLIVCAGLRSDRFAASLGRSGDLRIVPFRGEYYELRPEARDRVRGMVYPVPDPRYPFLGVHLTRHVDDTVHVGPNAVLALALEGYQWTNISPHDLAQMALWPGTWQLARQHWRSGLKEVSGSLSKRRYLADVRAYLPDLQLPDLVRSKSGVRAQAVRRDGSLEDDFVLQADGRVLLVRNAPSPAATASLAIAEHVVSTVGA